MIQRMQPAHHAGQKRRNEISLGTRLFHRSRHTLLQSSNLYFNVEESGVAITLQYFFESRRRFPGRVTGRSQPLQRAAANYQAMERWIVADDAVLVARGPDVKLKTMGAVFQRQVERGQGVFRRVATRAAMSEQ